MARTKTTHTQKAQKHAEHQEATDIQKKTKIKFVCFFQIVLFLFFIHDF